MAKQRQKIDKKDSKRVKISMEDISKEWKKIDPAEMKKNMDKHYEEDKKKVESDKLRYEKDLQLEEERFNSLPCPSCKGVDKKRNIISHMNEPVIYGGKNSSTVYADYLICQGCGTMYVDLHKKEIAPAYKGMFSSLLFRGGY